MVATTGAAEATDVASRQRWLTHGPTVGAITGLAFAVWGLRIGLRPIRDNSFFTHLATGRLIVDQGIVRRDPYTFTAFGEAWVVQSWLASAVYGLLDFIGGTRALQVFTGAVASSLAFVHWRLTRPAGGIVARIGLAAVALMVASGSWSERPMLLGLAALALTMLVVHDTDRDLRWLVPLAWIWVNVHGSFPLGVVALGAIAIGRRLDGERASRALVALRWFAIGVVAAAVNPLGPRLLAFPVELLQRNDALRSIVEWQAPRFESTTERAFLLLLVLGAVALVRRPAWRIAIPFSVFAVLALTSARNLAVATVVIVAVTSEAFAGLGTLASTQRHRLGRAAVAAMAVLGVIVGVTAVSSPALVIDAYPTAALRQLESRGLLNGDHRMATRDYVGNLLAAAYGDDARVFVDDRVELTTDALLDDYKVLLLGRPGWSDVLARHEIDVVLWDRASPLARVLELDAGWHTIYVDSRWVAAQRRT